MNTVMGRKLNISAIINSQWKAPLTWPVCKGQNNKPKQSKSTDKIINEKTTCVLNSVELDDVWYTKLYVSAT